MTSPMAGETYRGYPPLWFEAALAPLEWVKAEVTILLKGHVATATSWTYDAGCQTTEA